MHNDLKKEYVSTQSFVIEIQRKVSLKKVQNPCELYMMMWMMACSCLNNMVDLCFGVSLESWV